jgi:apolipoprotein N-acyltransferase
MDEKKKQSTTLMWFARISGVLLSSIWLYYFIRYVYDVGLNSLQDQSSVGIILFLLIFSLSIGVCISWKNPLAGGKFIIVLSVLLSLFNYFSTENNRIISVIFQGFPYFLVGIFFIQSQFAKEENP